MKVKPKCFFIVRLFREKRKFGLFLAAFAVFANDIFIDSKLTLGTFIQEKLTEESSVVSNSSTVERDHRRWQSGEKLWQVLAEREKFLLFSLKETTQRERKNYREFNEAEKTINFDVQDELSRGEMSVRERDEKVSCFTFSAFSSWISSSFSLFWFVRIFHLRKNFFLFSLLFFPYKCANNNRKLKFERMRATVGRGYFSSFILLFLYFSSLVQLFSLSLKRMELPNFFWFLNNCLIVRIIGIFSWKIIQFSISIFSISSSLFFGFCCCVKATSGETLTLYILLCLLPTDVIMRQKWNFCGCWVLGEKIILKIEKQNRWTHSKWAVIWPRVEHFSHTKKKFHPRVNCKMRRWKKWKLF